MSETLPHPPVTPLPDLCPSFHSCPAPSQYVEVAEHLSQHPGVLLPQAVSGGGTRVIGGN